MSYDFNFKPESEEDLLDLLEEGEGSFEVIAAERKDSNAGNPMIVLNLKVWDKNGEQKFIKDYLILGDKKFFKRHIRHFCYSCGLEQAYNDGKFNASDCVGKTGNLTIGIQKEGFGKDGKFYKAKNIVIDYINSIEESKIKVKVNSNLTSSQDEKFDDEIPF